MVWTCVISHWRRWWWKYLWCSSTVSYPHALWPYFNISCHSPSGGRSADQLGERDMVCSFQDVSIVPGDYFLLDEPMRFGTRTDQYQAHPSNVGPVTLCANEPVPMVLHSEATAVLVKSYTIAHSFMFLHDDFVCNRSLIHFPTWQRHRFYSVKAPVCCFRARWWSCFFHIDLEDIMARVWITICVIKIIHCAVSYFY
jgi:hypothetical protein